MLAPRGGHVESLNRRGSVVTGRVFQYLRLRSRLRGVARALPGSARTGAGAASARRAPVPLV